MRSALGIFPTRQVEMWKGRWEGAASPRWIESPDYSAGFSKGLDQFRCPAMTFGPLNQLESNRGKRTARDDTIQMHIQGKSD